MKNILVVEDNHAHVRLIQEVFKERKQTTILTAVKDGIEAMAYLRQEDKYSEAARPDIILLDLNLPRKNGREVLAELKEDPDLKRIPVLVLTNSRRQEDIDQSYDLHANSYITKPRDLHQLFKVFQQIEEFWLETVTLASKPNNPSSSYS